MRATVAASVGSVYYAAELGEMPVGGAAMTPFRGRFTTFPAARRMRCDGIWMAGTLAVVRKMCILHLLNGANGSARMVDYSGGCLCGATRYQISEAPRFAISCFCSDCQRATGTGHAPQFAVGKAAVSLSGPLKHHRATSAAGNDLSFGFCGTCGSPITKRTAAAPELLFIYAGSLDDPAMMPKPKPVFEASRRAWDTS